MTTTLIVLAHPEPTSFNGAWAEATARACVVAGHEVLRSDLCAMGFDPVETPGHYRDPPVPFDPLKAQEAASAAGALPGPVANEIAKLKAADLVVLHFPIWWFAPPAILKGWCERVFVHGGLHDTETRFDSGRFGAKRVLFCVTTGATAAECGPDGKEGDVRVLLWPLAQTWRYLGATVLVPEVVHGVHGYHKGAAKAGLEDRLAAVLAGQGALIAGLETRPALAFNPEGDFDADGRLRPGAPRYAPSFPRAR